MSQSFARVVTGDDGNRSFVSVPFGWGRFSILTAPLILAGDGEAVGGVGWIASAVGFPVGVYYGVIEEVAGAACRGEGWVWHGGLAFVLVGCNVGGVWRNRSAAPGGNSQYPSMGWGVRSTT